MWCFCMRGSKIGLRIHFFGKPVCFKMENEIERKFYEQLDAKIKNKKQKFIFEWWKVRVTYSRDIPTETRRA